MEMTMNLLGQFIIAAATDALHDWFEYEKSRHAPGAIEAEIDMPKWVEAAITVQGEN
jgi:hypothetical protein